MRDKRRVDELSIEELEQVLAMRKREERMKRLERMKRNGRVIEPPPQAAPPPPPPTAAPVSLDDVIASIAQNPRGTPTLIDDEPPAPRPRSAVQSSARASQGGKPLKRAAKRMTNSLLLLIEVAAVVGLVYLGWELVRGISVLQENSAEAQAAIAEANARTVPTIAPTPFLTLAQVVLPGGHVFVEGQTPTLNIEEIPENVRLAVADQIMRPVLTRPPATDETALRLTIPALNIDQTIVQGSDWEALKQGVGQVLNGYNPTSETGNVALTAHNDIYGELFRDLDQLQPGDQFQIQTRTKVYLYQVTRTEIVAPTDVHVLNSVDKPTAVLISCYPYRVNTQRIVVFADRIG